MSESECRNANWYDLGWRDARFKLQSQDVLYAGQCERYGIKMDTAGYDKGYREGRWEFPDRTPLRLHGTHFCCWRPAFSPPGARA